MFRFIFILVLINGIFKYSEAVCNQCNVNNGVACISKTEFYICANGVPVSSNTFSCLNSNEICTKHGTVCMDSTLTTGILPACGDTSNCGECKDINDGSYTCTSRTNYTMCFDSKLTDIRMSCAENEICDITIAAEGFNPCVPECKEPQIKICDLKDAIDGPTTTTVAPTTTTVPTTTTKKTTTQETPNIPTTTVEITTTTPKAITTTTEEITTTTIFSPTPTTVRPTPSTPAITTTTRLPTTQPPTSTTVNPANIVCSQQTAVGRYPNPNDKTCHNYVYCFRKNGVMESTFLTCPGQLYFNPSTSLCGELKPQGCI